MYCHCIGWCIRKCPLYRGVLYSEYPYQRFHCISTFVSRIQCLHLFRVKEILGFDAKDFIGSTFKDYFHPMDHAKMLPCSDLCECHDYVIKGEDFAFFEFYDPSQNLQCSYLTPRHYTYITHALTHNTHTQ